MAALPTLLPLGCFVCLFLNTGCLKAPNSSAKYFSIGNPLTLASPSMACAVPALRFVPSICIICESRKRELSSNKESEPAQMGGEKKKYYPLPVALHPMIHTSRQGNRAS